jgi:hypothetical protein
MSTYKPDTWKWDAEAQKLVKVEEKKTEVDAPFVQDDTIPPTESHATDERKIFTSRSELYAHYKQHGFECVGKGHETGRAVGPNRKQFDCDAERARKAEWGMLKVDPDVRAVVATELNKTKWGMAPLSEREKERCSREERIYQDYLKRQRA